MTALIISISILALIIGGLYAFRMKLRPYLIRLSYKLQFKSVREAIIKADQAKEKTGRKNLLAFNVANLRFEPVEKRRLKDLASVKANPKRANVTKNGHRPPANGWKGPTRSRRASRLRPSDVAAFERKSIYSTN